MTMDEIIALLNHIMNLLQANAWEEISEVLRTMIPETVELERPLTWLRATYAAREFIPEWEPFLTRFEAELKRRGVQDSSILQGLFQD